MSVVHPAGAWQHNSWLRLSEILFASALSQCSDHNCENVLKICGEDAIHVCEFFQSFVNDVLRNFPEKGQTNGLARGLLDFWTQSLIEDILLFPHGISYPAKKRDFVFWKKFDHITSDAIVTRSQSSNFLLVNVENVIEIWPVGTKHSGIYWYYRSALANLTYL